MKSILTNWKTTSVAGALILVNGLDALMPILPDKYAAIANGLIAAVGLFYAKDGNVTGGNVKQILPK